MIAQRQDSVWLTVDPGTKWSRMSGRGTRRRRWSMLVVGLVVATATSAFIAGIRAKPTLVALAGAVAAAAAVALTEPARRAQDAKHRRSEALTSPELVKFPAPSAPLARRMTLPRVRDITNPRTLGVHPASLLPHSDAIPPQIAALPPNMPRYVPRDSDRDLHSALTEAKFVLVVGDSTAGKTRSAYEAVQTLLPDYCLLNPARNGLAPLLDADAVPSRCLMWLDDLQDHMGSITAPMIRRLLEIPDVIVLATMRATEYDRYAPKEDSASAADYDRNEVVNGWELLSLAVNIRMNRAFSRSERARVRDYMDDPRIAEAASHLDEYGLAEYMAAGPRLLERWRNAWDVGGHPAGAAIVAAAVDCRRTGVLAPLAQDLLRELHHYYLAEHGGDRLRPEPFSDALAWATERVHATSSLLIPTSDTYGTGYLAFDYLVDVAQRDPAFAPIPFVVWGAMLDYAEATTAAIAYTAAVSWSSVRRRFRELDSFSGAEKMFQLAVALERRGNISEAVRWFRQAANSGHGFAASRLGSIEHRRGKLDAAEQWYRRAAESGDVNLVCKLAEFYYEMYGITAAEAVWRDAEERIDPTTALAIGYFLYRKYELQKVVSWYEAANDAKRPAAMFKVGEICHERYGIASAKVFWQRNEDKITTAHSALAVGDFLHRKGEIDEAAIWYEIAADDGGAEALDRLEEIIFQADTSELIRRIAEQIPLLRLIHNKGADILLTEAEVREPIKAARQLAQLRELQGAHERAKRWKGWADQVEEKLSRKSDGRSTIFDDKVHYFFY
jgi:TPR repeat protein